MACFQGSRLEGSHCAPSPYSCGCKLSAEDRYKIDKTAMGDVMSRDKEKKPKSHGAAAEAGNVSELEEQVKEEEEEGEEEFEEGELEFGVGGISVAEEKELSTELEEILKSCGRAQSKPKLVPALTVESGNNQATNIANCIVSTCQSIM